MRNCQLRAMKYVSQSPLFYVEQGAPDYPRGTICSSLGDALAKMNDYFSCCPDLQSRPQSETVKAFGRLVRVLLEPELDESATKEDRDAKGEGSRIAVPVNGPNLSAHFGHCERFAIFDIDPEGKTIRKQHVLTPPGHEPGVFPRWPQEQGADVVIAGGLGVRAQSLFAQHNIKVVVGAPTEDAETIVRDYLDGSLKTDANDCDH